MKESPATADPPLICLIYRLLFEAYGPQGWWPLLELESENRDKKGAIQGYHRGDYSYPKNQGQQYEIILGTILTQNTSWTSARKALENLAEKKILEPESVLNLDLNILGELVRPAGFYNQKSRYLKEVTEFFLSLEGQVPRREDLLQVRGVGNETADSILLYAYNQPEFVVDAYTKRILVNLNIVDDSAGYMDMKRLFEDNLPWDVPLFQEYHALLVEHGKNYYQKKPYQDQLLENIF